MVVEQAAQPRHEVVTGGSRPPGKVSVMSLAAVALAAVNIAAEEGGEHEVNQALSWGIGGLALAILFGLMFALIAFGGGREHS